jgi:hypothetical protein
VVPGKSHVLHADENRADENRADENRADENRADENRADMEAILRAARRGFHDG